MGHALYKTSPSSNPSAHPTEVDLIGEIFKGSWLSLDSFTLVKRVRNRKLAALPYGACNGFLFAFSELGRTL